MWSFKNLFKKKEEKAQQLIGDYLQFINSMDAQLSCQANEIRLNQDLSFIREVFYYMASKPVADSIDLISEKFSMITPVLINQETGEMETEHDVLALLNRPNPDNTQSEFLFRYAAFYLMTGNSFIRSFGTTSFPPSEMSILLPTLINFEGDVVEGKVRAFTYQENSISQRFNISEEGGDLRYINRTNTSELWQVKNINPLGTTPYGLSLMNAIQLEIEQQIAANKHNLGLLENGARLSGILSTEGNLSKDQREFIKEQFRTLYTGSGNAGKTIFTEGGGGKVNYNQLSTSAKDMDFFVLKKDNKFDIYSRYKVPLPLVSPDHMTMDNYREAKLSLWDDAVIPLNNRLLEELEKMLFPKYRDLENFKLGFDHTKISTLREREEESIEAKRESNLFTVNELRNMLGLDSIDGGDVIYQPSTMVPLGFLPTGSNPGDIPKNRFVDILKRNKFSDHQIKEYLDRHYGS